MYSFDKIKKSIRYEIDQSGEINLHLNEFNFDHHPDIVNIKVDTKDISRYQNSTSIKQDLIDKIASYNRVFPNNIILSAGSDKALSLITKTLLDDSSRVVLTVPSYKFFENMLHETQSNICRFDISGKDSREIIDQLKEIDNVDFIYLCSPNNPTGHQYSFEQFKSISKFTKYLLVDMAYIEFNEFYLDASRLVDLGNVIITRTFSKAFGLAGLRIGYAISSHQIIDQLNNMSDPKSVTQIAMKYASTILDNLDYYYQQVIKSNESISALNLSLTSAIPSVKTMSGGNFLTIQLPTGYSSKEIKNRLSKKGIIVRDKSSLSGLNNSFRVSAGPLQYMGLVFDEVFRIPERSIDVIILNAGLGSRMKIDYPKCLFKIGDSCILEKQLSNLRHPRVNSIRIVVGFQSEKIEKFVSEDIRLIKNEKFRSENNWYSVKLGLNDVDGERDVMIIDGDLIATQKMFERFFKLSRSTLVIDEESGKTEESMKIYESGDKLILSKSKLPYQNRGEYIGQMYIAAEDILEARRAIDSGNKEYYEERLTDSNIKWGFLSTFSEKWIEMDCQQDLVV